MQLFNSTGQSVSPLIVLETEERKKLCGYCRITISGQQSVYVGYIVGYIANNVRNNTMIMLCSFIFIFIYHKGSTKSNNEIIQYTIATAQ